MKTEQLMEAIENIDDRYIEESAYGIRKTSRIPWGMIITAACFCLVIGATIFMQSLGILPHLNGTTPSTSQPVTTEPSNTTEPGNTTEPFSSEPDMSELQAIDALFQGRQGWYYRALVDTFTSPKELHLRYYFYNSTELGGNLQPTKEEMDELMELMPDGGTPTLVILPVSKMDTILKEVFGITVAEMESAAFAGMKYVESIDSWCFWGSGTLNTSEMIAPRVTKESKDIFRVTYRIASDQFTSYELILWRYNDSYYIQSNAMIESNDPPETTGPTIPDETTAPTIPDGTTAPTTPPEWEKYNELFKGSSWFNQALTCEYDSPKQIDILNFFYCGFQGESKISDEEWAQLKNMLGFGSPAGDICRLPPDKMNAVLTECFGITLEDVDPTGFNGLAYLESTNCYYFKASAPNGVWNFTADNVVKNSDGTVCVYYNISYKGDYVVTVKPYGDGYRILSNKRIKMGALAPDLQPTGDTELEKLFAGYEKMPEKDLSQKMVDAFLADPDTFVRLLAKQTRDRVILGVLSRNVTDHHPQIGAYRATVSSMLAKELPEKEKIVVYGMAVYSGLSNYIPDTPTAADYRMILDVLDRYDYHGETIELLRKFCIEDAAGVIAVIVQDKESRTIYIERITALTSQEELEQIEESVSKCKEELSKMSGEGIQEQIKYAELNIESCDEELQS